MVEKEHKGKEAVPAAMLYYAIKEKNFGLEAGERRRIRKTCSRQHEVQRVCE